MLNLVKPNGEMLVSLVIFTALNLIYESTIYSKSCRRAHRN